MKREFRFEFNFSKNQLSIYCTFNIQFKVFKYVCAKIIKYRWTSLYAIDRDQKNNDFAYKKNKNDCKLGESF